VKHAEEQQTEMARLLAAFERDSDDLEDKIQRRMESLLQEAADADAMAGVNKKNGSAIDGLRQSLLRLREGSDAPRGTD
jgi:polyhydroxyalkanoate synthesis regulator phasin